jgi:uncharacterized protein (TIGR03000 family)
MKILTLAGLGLVLAAGAAKAQQGWPIVGSNWDTTGGSRGSYRSSYSRGYSPSYYSPSYYYPATPSPVVTPSYYAAYPYWVGSYSPYRYSASSSGGYYSTSTADAAGNLVARVNLKVPGDAKIWFNTFQTKQTGTARSFRTPPLDRGSEYTYQIRVQWNQDGKDVTQSRHVSVHAGDVINLTLAPTSGASTAQ